MIWAISYWHTENGIDLVEKWLDTLTREQLKSVARELKLLEKCGNSLKPPHSKALGKGLFELRERKFGFRLYYSFLRNREVILLHAGDKSSQGKDIKIARRRLSYLTFS